MPITEKKVIRSERLGEEYTLLRHSSGLDLLLYPMEGFTGAYATLITKYGSIDTCFKTQNDPDFVEVPEGIAHFLEHKLFEGENGEDAFNRYAETGASANAYTSFDRTAYLFSCTDNFAASLEILLDFATHPYFTPETVKKEQGIIGQEIQMEQDNPEWRVFFNLLRAVYHKNPVRIDIAGSVESIAQIDADLLYRCYNTFYNLRNMVLAVAGNFSPEEVILAADKLLTTAPELTIEHKIPDEPLEIAQAKIEETAQVATPLFHIGFKGDACEDEAENLKNQLLDEILIEMIAGEASPLYRRMYDAGIINATFSTEVMAGRDFSLLIFSGESREPERVRDEIVAEIAHLAEQGLDRPMFERCRRAAYGRYIGSFGRSDSVAGIMAHCYFAGIEAYEILDLIADLKPEPVEARLALLDPARCAISIVRP